MTRAIKGRNLIIECLEKQGVEVIFGYPGGASMEIHQALTMSKKIRMLLPRHEQGAAFAACGYARATGKPGVCLATSGPGATNLITGIADAKLDSVPMIAITGQVSTQVLGTDAFQEVDIVGGTLPNVKHSYFINDIHDIPRVIEEAFLIATTGRPGPVLIDIPKNIQQQTVEHDFSERKTRFGYVVNTEPSQNAVKRALELIELAKKPLIYAGGGIIASEASKELVEFIDKTGIPITTTLMGLGCFPESRSESLRMLGMHGAVYANIAINNADLVLALGTRFDDRVTGKLEEFCGTAKVVHVDIDASEINKNKVVDVPIQGDVKAVLQQWNESVNYKAPQEWLDEVQGYKKKFAHSYSLSPDHIAPQRVIAELSKFLKEDDIVSVGVGQHQMWTAQFYGFQKPRTWLCSSGLGAMGFGLPAAMGAQVAHPHKTVIDIDGDGSFLMNIQELQTLKVENLPVKCIVLNNKHLGMVAQWEDRFYESVRGHTYIGEANFADIAKGFGIAGETISHPDDVLPALKRMFEHKGPYVLDVKYPYNDATHGHVVPMIPSGKSYLDTILTDGNILRNVWKN